MQSHYCMQPARCECSQAASCHKSPRHSKESCPVGENTLVKSSASPQLLSTLTSTLGPAAGTCQKQKPHNMHILYTKFDWIPQKINHKLHLCRINLVSAHLGTRGHRSNAFTKLSSVGPQISSWNID